MYNSQRITIEEIQEAYGALGIKPAKECFYLKKANCGCPMAALVIHKNSNYLDRDWMNIEMKEIAYWLERPTKYCEGFMHGFDNPEINHQYWPTGDPYRLGVEDGERAHWHFLGKDKEEKNE